MNFCYCVCFLLLFFPRMDKENGERGFVYLYKIDPHLLFVSSLFFKKKYTNKKGISKRGQESTLLCRKNKIHKISFSFENNLFVLLLKHLDLVSTEKCLWRPVSIPITFAKEEL